MVQYTCRRESYILQTKGCPQWTTLYFSMNYTLLLKPRCNVVASPEIVQCQTQPACCQNNNSHNQLTNDTDRLLQNIQYTPDRADKTYQPNNCSHFNNLFKFYKKLFFLINLLTILHITQEQTLRRCSSTRLREVATVQYALKILNRVASSADIDQRAHYRSYHIS